MSPTTQSPHTEADFRRVQPGDYPAILALQEANLYDNLTAEQRRQGFLSARFSRDQFAAMNDDVAVAVAQVGGEILGYLCGSSVELNRQFALLAAMIECYPRLQWDGRALDSYRSFVYGPVCIDARGRGKGLLRGLYGVVSTAAAARYELGVGFIAQNNAHSLAAHVQGLGMRDLGGFEFKQRFYRILASAV
jgi:hypothetical protein